VLKLQLLHDAFFVFLKHVQLAGNQHQHGLEWAVAQLDGGKNRMVAAAPPVSNTFQVGVSNLDVFANSRDGDEHATAG
jgi:hypothetical protein